MTISNQKAFDSILSMAQNMLRLASERAKSAITPEMIEKELNKLAVMMEDDFALVDRNALARGGRHRGGSSTDPGTGSHRTATRQIHACRVGAEHPGSSGNDGHLQ